MASIYDVLSHCSDLSESLSTVNDKEKRKSLINQHIKKLSGQSSFKVPEFSKEFEWLNVSEPLSLSNQLSGKIVVLDFFTYCCINCMHVLPDLHALEEKFSVKDGVVVLGVHSAKFENEKLTANILSAILRYDITHPVVNDSEATLWKKLEVVCWPTFVILGPSGQYLFNLVGEGHREELFEFVETAVEYFKSEGELKSYEVPISLEKLKLPATPLRYPGKIELSDDELIISDSGNHRILITDLNGIVQNVIGNGEKGFKDGDYETAMFSSPQGCCRLDDYIYIADTENHAIRKVDLKSKHVTTIAGTGQMGNDKEGGVTGVNQILSSPWDVCIGRSPGSTRNDVLYIAMAGTHQIWVYFLQDVTWYKAMKYSSGTCIRFAGSGAEENRNNSYPQKAGFAQPSGLTLSNDSLYIADSESSSIRYISLKDGAVKGLVGGERDPTNLFAYGDVDGKGVEAKLQHPLGLIASQSTDQLYMADSYNHKIKCVDLKTKMCTTILGRTEVSDKGDTTLNEPSGLALDTNKQKLYIADTNNNTIKVLDLKTMVVSQVSIDGIKQKA
ncbi:hypothetical protein LOTGIDRAFT_119776 [Lottia gigantea]|uniref:NHL repeat-containing protein 2 n=1 Tax=Lottia gigantea TaxID=225164 RepID=V4A8P4_LOTGI|nr:hypothetical protein LOTGIDRAFT_119776 [Lottia gigantea]ESO93122.1 hypothetical protein LOTGIDRAFT_119776 [Lottia gigantea]